MLNASVTNIFRLDRTNVGDSHCAPSLYFDLGRPHLVDIINFEPEKLEPNTIVGGGGLIAKNFHRHMEKLANYRPKLTSLIAWGIGESQIVNRKGGFVPPYSDELPKYLELFDLVGLRDFGTRYRWVPCPSCMLPHFDNEYAVEHEMVLYEHKRIPLPISGIPKLSNDGSDVDAAIKFLASGKIVLTNSYHGAYWATLLRRRVLCIPNMSKVYRLKHLPVIGRVENWGKLVDCTVQYPEALQECRSANVSFYKDVLTLLKSTATSSR